MHTLRPVSDRHYVVIVFRNLEVRTDSERHRDSYVKWAPLVGSFTVPAAVL